MVVPFSSCSGVVGCSRALEQQPLKTGGTDWCPELGRITLGKLGNQEHPMEPPHLQECTAQGQVTMYIQWQRWLNPEVFGQSKA